MLPISGLKIWYEPESIGLEKSKAGHLNISSVRNKVPNFLQNMFDKRVNILGHIMMPLFFY